MDKTFRILVVDDEENIRKVLRKILEKAGYNVDVAKNGQEAIEKTKSTFFNLALIDIRLPDMDGTKLLKEIKETTPTMVKIIITGYPTLENAIKAVNKGANAYITKPFKVNAILQTIRENLKKQEEATKYSQEKVLEFIETKAKELETTT